jgi:hypothetical protein
MAKCRNYRNGRVYGTIGSHIHLKKGFIFCFSSSANWQETTNLSKRGNTKCSSGKDHVLFLSFNFYDTRPCKTQIEHTYSNI